jgi:hypothetical protein
MVNTDILDTWICYKISNGEREELKEENNAPQWTFSEDGTVTYLFKKDESSGPDKLERHWRIEQREKGAILLINEEETYRIITLEGGILILESIKGDGIRHYYANKATYEQRKDQLP